MADAGPARDPVQLGTALHALPLKPEPPSVTSFTPSSSAAGASADVNARPILLVLVGLPGSGKTTFGNALVSQLDNWARFSQDESASGRRQEVEAAVAAALAKGQNVIVDRVNFDPTQREHFLNIARQLNAQPLAIVLKAPMEVLRSRLQGRTDHPTLKDPETALKVLRRMKRELVYPQQHEGFQRVLFVDSEGDWTKERIEDILEKLEKEGTTGQRPGRGGYGGYRGGAGGYDRSQRGGAYAGRGRGGWGPPRDSVYGGKRGGFQGSFVPRGGYAREGHYGSRGGHYDRFGGHGDASGYPRGGYGGRHHTLGGQQYGRVDRSDQQLGGSGRASGIDVPSARYSAPELLPSRPTSDPALARQL